MRLAAEVAWLPGVSPSKAEELIAKLEANPLKTVELPGLPTLAHINLIAAAFELTGTYDFAQLQPPEAANFIQTFAHLMEAIDPGEIFRDINEDRAVSGFSEVQSVALIEAELAQIRRKHRNAVKDGLNRMRPAELVATMTELVRTDTDNGECQAAAFIDDLVDVYQDETKGFLQQETEKLLKLLANARTVASNGSGDVAPIISKVGEVARNWVRVAEPIQLSLKSRGLDDELSQRIAYPIRNLGYDLFKDHGLLDQAQRVTQILQDLFAYVPDIAARVQSDAEGIQEIVAQRETAAHKQAEWAEKITYRTEIGLLFKDKLSISPDGITLKDRHYPLESITRIRWGGVRHSVNGIPTGTIYTVAVGDNHSEGVMTLKDSSKYGTFIDKLWQAVGVRLMGEMLSTLRSGKQLIFGDATVDDLGVTLLKRRVLSANERVHCDWWHIKIWSADGNFYIASKEDNKTYSSMSYIKTPNAHLIEHMIRLSFKNPKKKLSALLD